MRIADIKVDGFGVWNGLCLDDLSENVTVFYGPNEAGKTTLLEFVRAVLYGFHGDDTRRYLPPLRGGQPGGALVVDNGRNRVQVVRHLGDDGGDRATIINEDGSRQTDHALKLLLYGVDESIFSNVFAVGLREIQELGTLSDTDASRLLYDLSAGLDRISLSDVMRELVRGRQRLIADDDEPCQVSQLLDERKKLRHEIEQLRGGFDEFNRLASEQKQTDRRIEEIEQEITRQEKHSKITEVACTIRDQWLQREALREELEELGPQHELPEEAVERVAAWNAEAAALQKQREELHRLRAKLRDESAALPINEELHKAIPRIEAVNEQLHWMEAFEAQIASLETEIADLGETWHDEKTRLGFGAVNNEKTLAAISQQQLDALRGPARAMKETKGVIDEYLVEAEEKRAAAEAITEQIDKTLVERGAEDVTSAMETKGSEVTQLRRRVQVDERLEELRLHREDLDEQSHDLLSQQMLPMPVFTVLGGVFVFGVVLVLAGLFMPTSVVGGFGWALAILGLFGAAAAGAYKFVMERTADYELEACNRQLKMLAAQIEQANKEREALDADLPPGGGPLLTRLSKSEKELAELEKLVPLEQKRQAAEAAADKAEQAALDAQEAYEQAKRDWRRTVEKLGLPRDLTPKEAKQLSEQGEKIGRVHKRLDHRMEEIQNRRKELARFARRIELLMADCDVRLETDDAKVRLAQLTKLAEQQKELVQQRNQMKATARKHRDEQKQLAATIDKLRTQRRALLREAGAVDEDELQRLHDNYQRAVEIEAELEELDAEILAALHGVCTEETLAEQLDDVTAEELETRWDGITASIESYNKQLKELFVKRGQVSEQLKSLGKDRRLMERQLDLFCVEKQLEEALAEWQVVASTNLMLDSMRQQYEKERQPETLLLAATYLQRLTGGHYQRIWTPLTEDVLYVDDQEGQSHTSEQLSSGTREQLFLALRLSLVTCYGRRGIHLPIVLDDVFVNFDAERTRAAAELVKEFAASGHQVLVFTCHEHVQELFRSLEVDVRRLPDNHKIRARSGAAEIVIDQPQHAPVVEQPQPRPKKKKVKVKLRRQPEEELVLEEAPMFIPPPQPKPAAPPAPAKKEPVVELKEEDLELDYQPLPPSPQPATAPLVHDGYEEYDETEEIDLQGYYRPQLVDADDPLDKVPDNHNFYDPDPSRRYDADDEAYYTTDEQGEYEEDDREEAA